MEHANREFLFTYRYGGSDWGVNIFAADEAEAREKIKMVAFARYDGELYMRIPASLGAFGIVPSVMCWLRQRGWIGSRHRDDK